MSLTMVRTNALSRGVLASDLSRRHLLNLWKLLTDLEGYLELSWSESHLEAISNETKALTGSGNEK